MLLDWIRVWTSAGMIKPKQYSLIRTYDKEKETFVIKAQCAVDVGSGRRRAVLTEDFMLSCGTEKDLFYELDIVTFEYNDDMFEGIIYTDSFAGMFYINCIKGKIPLSEARNIKVLGNKYETPALYDKVLKSMYEEMEKNKTSKEEIKQTPPSKENKVNNTVHITNDDFITIYTDGSCLGNPGPGGSAFIIIKEDGEVIEKSFSFEHITNNAAELNAVLYSLVSLPDKSKIKLYSDSQYIIDAFNKNWLNSWIKNDWKKSDGKEVKNLDIWKKLYKEVSRLNIEWNWVRGHVGNKYNERCDSLAREAASKFTA